MKNIIGCFRRFALPVAVLALTVLQGCISDDSSCPPPLDREEGVNMRFDIVTRNIRSRSEARSRGLVVPGNTQVGTSAENYLDIPGMTFLFFDADRQLINYFYPSVTPGDKEGYTRYEVNAVITDPYFTEPAAQQLTFYVMVLANYSGHSPQGIGFSPGQTLEEIFDMKVTGTFAAPKGSPWWYPHIEEAGAGVSPRAPQFIPMSGLQRFTVTVAELAASTADQPLRFEDDINMLRTLAKIEVIDRINAVGEGAATRQPDKTERAYIDKVELMGHYDRVALLPSLPQWSQSVYPETQYVLNPSIPASAYYIEPYAIDSPQGGHEDAVICFGEDEDATKAREDGCTVYSAYVPEYEVRQGYVPAWLQVTVNDPQNAGAGDMLYPMRLTGYTDGLPAGDEIPLLRNNIYRYEVRSVSSELSVEWTVCPMDEANINIPDFN